MRYVVDSSVAIKWVLPEADSAKATRLRDEYVAGIHEFVAPDIFLPEVANALAMAERQRRIKSGEAAVFLLDIVRAAPVLLPTQPLLLRAMTIAVSAGRAVYDCVYLALAEAESCELLTADDQFARGIRSVFPFVVSLATMP